MEQSYMNSTDAIELTVLMPCLNEEKTIGICIQKALNCMRRLGISGEIVIADNGSIDRSCSIAASMGARVVRINEKGYGAALIGGIQAAKGQYIIMGDSDDSYDFSSLDGFIDLLRQEYDLVMGNRFAGGIEKDAMPPLHKYLGNPVLSFLGRILCNIQVGDFHCGLRGFNRKKILSLGLSCSGMEFASEMIVKAANRHLKIAEIPVVLSKDGRDRAPHLRSFRDGWRHLRFLLLASPRWLFFYPGLILLMFCLGLFLPLMFGPIVIGAVGLDIHSLVYLSTGIAAGIQMIVFASLLTRMAEVYGFQQPSALTRQLGRLLSFERALILGGIFILIGVIQSASAFSAWGESSFGAMDPQALMRRVIPACLVIMVGLQVVIGAALVAGLDIITDTARAAR